MYYLDRLLAALGSRDLPEEIQASTVSVVEGTAVEIVPLGSKGEGLDDAQAEEEPEDAVPEEPDAAPADVFPAMNRFLGIAAPGVVA